MQEDVFHSLLVLDVQRAIRALLDDVSRFMLARTCKEEWCAPDALRRLTADRFIDSCVKHAYWHFMDWAPRVRYAKDLQRYLHETKHVPPACFFDALQRQQGALALHWLEPSRVWPVSATLAALGFCLQEVAMAIIKAKGGASLVAPWQWVKYLLDNADSFESSLKIDYGDNGAIKSFFISWSRAGRLACLRQAFHCVAQLHPIFYVFVREWLKHIPAPLGAYAHPDLHAAIVRRWPTTTDVPAVWRCALRLARLDDAAMMLDAYPNLKTPAMLCALEDGGLAVTPFIRDYYLLKRE
jgi:hypothetical protein